MDNWCMNGYINTNDIPNLYFVDVYYKFTLVLNDLDMCRMMFTFGPTVSTTKPS